MNSNSLLGSLIRNSTNSRSTSLFAKTITNTLTNDQKPRSLSQHKELSEGAKIVFKLTPLCHAVHLLAVKLKKLHYFLFCRLESNMKKKRSQQKLQRSILAQKEKVEKAQTNNPLNQGCKKIIDCINIIEGKFIATIQLGKFFKMIRFHSNKIESAHRIKDTLGRIIKSVQLRFCNTIERKYQTYLKLDIMVQVFSNIIRNYKSNYFLQIVLCSSKRQQILIQQKKIEQSQISYSQALHSIEEQSSNCSQSQISQNNSQQSFTDNMGKQMQATETYRKQIQIEEDNNKSEVLTPKNYNSCKNQVNNFSKMKDQSKGVKPLKKYIIINANVKNQYEKLGIRIQQPRKIPQITKAIIKMPRIQSLKDVISNSTLVNGNIPQSITKLNKLHPEKCCNQIPDLIDNQVFAQPFSNQALFDSENPHTPECQQYWIEDERALKFNTVVDEFRPFSQADSAPKLKESNLLNSNSSNRLFRDENNKQSKINDNQASRFVQIERMMKDLENIKQKSFMACWTEQSPSHKFDHNVSRNKVVVNLSSKKGLNSATKDNNADHSRSINFNSDKKQKKRDKQNIQVRLFQMKDKLSINSKDSNQKHNKSTHNGVGMISGNSTGDYSKFMSEMKKTRPQVQNNQPQRSKKNSLNSFKLIFDQRI